MRSGLGAPVRALLGLAVVLLCNAAAASQPIALHLQVQGAIGPVTADYISRGIEEAARRDLRLVILQLDTPGGLDAAMRDIVKVILASPVPVAGYVAPAGARAASAGTYILYASHIAAAAPATNLGAATPVQLGGLPISPKQPPPDSGPDQAEPDDNASAMQRKAVKDAEAYLRSLAELRGRNIEWAGQAVTEGASLSARAALTQQVIDILADDLADLLRQIDGRRIQLSGGEAVLETGAVVIEAHQPDWRNELLSVLTNPNLAYMLLLVGIYGLIIEFYSPGYYLPGVVGAISLLLALFAFQLLPINYAGLALLLLGLGFMIAEAFLPSFGALGLGGALAFAFGSMMLVDDSGQAISLPLVIGTTLVSAAFSVWVLARLAGLRRKPVVTGVEELIGSRGVALTDFVDGEGRIWIHGESWRGRGQCIHKDQPVRVVGIQGLVLEVESETGEA